MSETTDFYIAVRRNKKDGFEFLFDKDGEPILMTKTAAENHLRNAVENFGSVNVILLRNAPVEIGIEVKIEE